MSRKLRGAFWIGLYMLLSVSPLIVVLLGAQPTGRSFALEFAVALGFVALAMLCLQFAMTARFRRVAAPFGIDMILQFHRQISLLIVGLLVAHPLIQLIADPGRLAMFNVFTTSWSVRFGLLAFLALAMQIGSSLYRQALGLRYETWHLLHAALAVLALIAALAHVLGIGHYTNLPWKRAFLDLVIAATVLLLVYVRLIKPAFLWYRPYRVAEVRPERGNVFTLMLEPDGHPGLRFRPGQFAWLRVGQSPFALENHPFSFTSSAEHPDRLALTIKALGDFTSTIGEVQPGARAYLDGPYGVFTPDRFSAAPGYVFVAGGIGITPFMSMLRTFADRQEGRPLLLLYANRNWEGVTFREELDELQRKLNLTVVHVLDKPPDGWTGERGFITDEVLARYLPEDRRTRTYYLCGPPPLMSAVERALSDVGVPRDHIHMERFNLV